MTARLLKLPVTPAGRALLRECIPFITDWCWPDGAPIDEDDFDQQAAEVERMMASPAREAQGHQGIRSAQYPAPHGAI